MADTVVSFLLTNLTQLLKDEANLLYGVEEKVLLIQQELIRIKAFLKGSEGKRDEHEVVKAVVSQIRDVAYEAQDVIDKYIVDLVHHRKKGILGKFFDGLDHAKMLRSVNNQIETIKAKIKDIYDNKDKYDIDESEKVAIEMEALAVAENVQRRRRDVEEDEVIGFDAYADEVINLIVQDNKSLQVVSIVGMVGCGKTTLARKVFRDPRLKVTSQQDDSFELAWEIVSKEFNAKELLLSLLRSFKAIPEDELKVIQKNEKESDNSTSKKQEIFMLKNMLREYLSDMRYLVVLDDVWSSEVLEEIRDAFPDDNMGSAIMITTRSEEVASKISTAKPYKLQRLSDEDSWLLFSKKVFIRGESCPPDLETAGRNIAIACKGLPLSIVVIAGILRSKEKSVRVWEKAIGNVNWFISQEDTLVKELVRLSYDTLPRRLKPCFLYFGIYPEDYDIPARQLLHLWIAEGFITENGNGSIIEEDVAEEYLEELIRRNLIQVESRRIDGGVKSCRIHDLLRELCMSESIKDNFLEVRTDINILNRGKPRRLSLHGNTSYYISESPCDHSSTRSLFNFSKDEHKAGYHMKDWLQKDFKLIRVLDMGKIKSSHHVLGDLEESIHLRYLRTRDNDSFSFPKSLYNLWNLETLDFRGSRFYELPEGIWKFKRLRHLYMSGSDAKLPNIPGKKVVPNLQTLSVVCLNQKTVEQLEKGKFPILRKLGVDCFNSYETNPIDCLQRLQRLTHLKTLKVISGKCALTNVVGFPPNITKITLAGGIYLSEIASPLGSLSKLRYLKVSGKDIYGSKFKKFKFEYTTSGCFPQLLVLKMTNLDFESWNMGESAMPQLRRLVIENCQLSTNLSSPKSFTSLQELEVLWSSKEVVEKFKHLVEKDSCKFTAYPAVGEQ